MKTTTTELEIKVSGGRIVEAILSDDGACKLVVETTAEPIQATIDFTEDALELVEASKLSMYDEFMQYEPKSEEEVKFKKILAKAIKSGKLKDFYCSKYEPSFNEDETGICYKPVRVPAIKKSWDWWISLTDNFSTNSSEWNVYIGSKSYYVAYLGTIIKDLIEKKFWSAQKAWHAVCVDSTELEYHLEFFPLAVKMVAEDENERFGGFLQFGGYSEYASYPNPLAGFFRCYNSDSASNRIAWLIFEKRTETKTKGALV